MNLESVFFSLLFCGLIYLGRCIQVSPKVELLNATQGAKVGRPDASQDYKTSSSFDFIRGLYPPFSPPNEYPQHHHPGHYHDCAPHPRPCSNTNTLFIPLQQTEKPKIKHTIKTVITEVKEVTTSLGEQDGFNSATGFIRNLSSHAAEKSATKEHDIQVVSSLEEDEGDSTEIPVFKGLLGLDPSELEENFIENKQIDLHRNLPFQPFGIFRPAPAATLSYPSGKPAAVNQAHWYPPKPVAFSPISLGYLRPRPGTLREDSTQPWKPSSIPSGFGIAPKSAALNSQKPASHPCKDFDKDTKEVKADSKIDSLG